MATRVPLSLRWLLILGVRGLTMCVRHYSVFQGRLSQLSGLDGGGSMSSAVSQQEQQLESIRREKERLASLIPQLHTT